MCSTNVKQLILKTFIQAQLFQQLIPKQNTVFTNAVRSLFVTLIHLYIFKLINCYIYIYKYNNLISAIIHSQHLSTHIMYAPEITLHPSQIHLSQLSIK